jgi:voltage-gated sodium channel
VILLNAAAIGLETSGIQSASYRETLAWVGWAAQGVFMVEMAIRVLAHWPRPARFFRNGWNLFDFGIVAVALLPQAGSFATVARVARLLRVARLISAFPELRLIVSTMLRSIPSMAHVLLLLGLLLYIYGVLGSQFFRGADPSRWGTLGGALLTLFQILTLEGWVEIQAQVLVAHPWAWIYFASFIILAVFVVTNLFIAIVINNLEAAKREQEGVTPDAKLAAAVGKLNARLDRFEERLLPPRDGVAAAEVTARCGEGGRAG